MSGKFPINHNPSGPWQPFDSDWFGRPPRHQARFKVYRQGSLLTFLFQADKKPEHNSSLKPGDFVEGLWEHDVAELFIRVPSGRYVELNLGPSGAWWCAEFSAYRQRRAVLRCPTVQTQTAATETAFWEASLTVERGDLPFAESDWETAHWNVTAILSPQQPEYLSFGHRLGGDPDFHLEKNFLAAEWL